VTHSEQSCTSFYIVCTAHVNDLCEKMDVENSFYLIDKEMIVTKIKITTIYHRHTPAIVRYLSQDNDNLPKGTIETNSSLFKTDDVATTYLRLIESTLDYMKIKYNKPQLLSSFLTNGTVEGLDQSSIDIKKFCSFIRISPNSPFNRNIIELILLPISKNIFLEEEKLYLSSSEDENFANYRNFIENDNIREACISYIFSTLKVNQDVIINSQMTLRSFQENSVVSGLLNKWKLNSIDQDERHLLLAIFLNLILFEVIQNNRGKRSKARIVNFLVDKLAKSSSTRN